MWKFKKDAAGNIILDANGNPIVIKPDGTETAYDINATTATIANLQAESKTHRTAKEAAETALQAFAGLDPVATKAALAKFKDVDLSKMIDAGKLDEVKKEITTAYDAKLAEKDAAFGKLQGNFHKTVKENVFAKSKFIADKLIVPPDMIMATFGEHVKVNDETGAVTFERNGMPIQSPDRPGEIANADEAIAELVKGYAYKDKIMKGANQSGSGSTGGNGGNHNGTTYTRAEFEKMGPADRSRVAAEMGVGKATVTD
jgi:hypothetical protein